MSDNQDECRAAFEKNETILQLIRHQNTSYKGLLVRDLSNGKYLWRHVDDLWQAYQAAWNHRQSQDDLRTFSVLWKEYALCPDEKLSEDAKELKKKLLGIVYSNSSQDALIRELVSALVYFANYADTSDDRYQAKSVLSKVPEEYL